MELTEHEKLFIQNQDAPDFPSYLKSAWHVWPNLKYSQIRRKASKLWTSRKKWLKTLEPTPDRLKKNCATCHSSFHQIWAPLVPVIEEVPLGNTILTVTQWETLFEPPEQQKDDLSCWGCKENQPNQLAHMDYGGCLYYDACDMGIADPYEIITLPPLPASPQATD